MSTQKRALRNMAEEKERNRIYLNNICDAIKKKVIQL